MEYSPPGSSVHGISQAAILEWVAISFSRGVFPTQGLNLYLLHWQADSLPLSHLRSPSLDFVVVIIQSSSYLQLHGVQHTRPPCPSPSPGVCPGSCPSHLWCHPNISTSDISFSFCPQSFPASEMSNESSVSIRWPKSWSFSFSINPSAVTIQGWSPLRVIGLISLLSEGLSGVFSSTTVQRHQFFGVLSSLQSSSNNHMWPLGRP